jgi:hypothetical protein
MAENDFATNGMMGKRCCKMHVEFARNGVWDTMTTMVTNQKRILGYGRKPSG